MDYSEKAKKARREYMRRYREKNREKINANQRKWYKENPEKVRVIKNRYLTNLADRYEQEAENEREQG